MMISIPARVAKSYFSNSKQGRRIFNRALLQAGADGSRKRPPPFSLEKKKKRDQPNPEARDDPFDDEILAADLPGFVNLLQDGIPEKHEDGYLTDVTDVTDPPVKDGSPEVAAAGEVYFLQAFELHAKQNENMKQLIQEIRDICRRNRGNPASTEIKNLIDERAPIFQAQTQHTGELNDRVNLALNSTDEYLAILDELCRRRDGL